MDQKNIFEEKIIKSFEKDIITLCKKYSVLKMSEELFRFTLYQNLIKQKINNKTILFEANILNEKTKKPPIKKIDFKFEDENNKIILIEMKFHRGLDSGNQRPHPHSYGKLLADFLKLSQDSIKKYDRYIIYLFDENYKEKYNNRLKDKKKKNENEKIFKLVDENIKKDRKFTLELNSKKEHITIDEQTINETMEKQINKFFVNDNESKTINTKIIHDSKIKLNKIYNQKLKNENIEEEYLYFKIYKII
ncbi:MAG: hypothetical protein GQ477_03160 [Nanohaloarchaea archaeon]|nr:hypothetical protein [Candidatus Nanohaloarchaea archaeon]